MHANGHNFATGQGHGATVSRLKLNFPKSSADAPNPASALEQNASAGTDLPEIQDAASLMAKTQQLPPELISGLLHHGSKMVVGGGSKSYKTWVLLDIAFSVAMGKPWLGFSTRQSRVLYVNLEIAEGFFTARIRNVSNAKQVALIKGRLDVWNLRGKAADISVLADKILAQIGSRYDLIIIDPIYKVLGGRDENKAGDIAEVLNELERIAVQADAAIVFGAHFSKGGQAGKNSMDRIGGSGVFARDPDSIITLTNHEEEGAYTVDLVLRNHPPLASFVARWDPPLMHRDDTLDPTRLKQTGGRPKKYDEQEILNLLPGDGLTKTQWLRIARTQAGISESTFHRVVAVLRKKQLIEQSSGNHGVWIKATVETAKTVN